MLRAVTLTLLLLAATTYAGVLDDISSKAAEVGDFFSKQFNNIKDLFAGNQSELEKNIEKVKELLTGIKEKMKVARDGAGKFEENSSKWQEMLSNIFQKGGLDNVLKLLNMKSSSPQCITIAAMMAPIVLTLIH
uniref:Secreted protein n=1 Tax=Angiostrongylus cantonensis TaxID=6313 RepID=A0A158P6B2_ANGCA